MTKPNLLLVDPDERNRRVLEISLRKAGFMVTLALDGVEAMQRLEVSCPDVIVSEFDLPKLDGIELCRQVRSSDRLADTPIVMLGAAEAADQRLHALSAGADEFVSRPVLLKEIIVRAKMLLERRERMALSAHDGPKTMRGQLSDMAVIDLIQTMEQGNKSGITHLQGPRGRRGAIYFRDGKIIDAEVATLESEKALYRLLIWSQGSFEVELKTIRRKAVIVASNEELLMEGMRRMDEWQRLCEQLPPLDTVFELEYDTLASRLGEIPDEVNAIIRLFDSRRSLIEVVDDAEFNDLEAMGVICKLYFEGLLHAVGPVEGVEDAPRPRRRTQRVGGLPAEGHDAQPGEIKKVDTEPMLASKEILEAEQEAMEALSSAELPRMEGEADAASGFDAEAFGAAAEAAGAMARESDDERSTDRYRRTDYGEAPAPELFAEGGVEERAPYRDEEIPEVQPMGADETPPEESEELEQEQGKELITLEAGELLPEVEAVGQDAAQPEEGAQDTPAAASEPAVVEEPSAEAPEAGEEQEDVDPFGEAEPAELIKASSQSDEVSGEIFIGSPSMDAERQLRQKAAAAAGGEPAEAAKESRRKKRKRKRKTRAAGSGQLGVQAKAPAEKEVDAEVAAQEVEVDRWLEEEGGARGQLIPFPRGRGQGEEDEVEPERAIEQAAKEAAERGESDDPSAASIDVRDEAFFASDYEPDPFADESFAGYVASRGKKKTVFALLTLFVLLVGSLGVWKYIVNDKYSDRRTAHLRIREGAAPIEAKPKGPPVAAKKKTAILTAKAQKQAVLTPKVAVKAKVAAPTTKVEPPKAKTAPAPKVTAKPEGLAAATPPAGERDEYVALVGQAQAALEQRKRAQARKLFVKARKLRPGGWEVLSYFAWQGYNRGRAKQAQKLAQQALRVNAKAPYANLVLGAVAHEAGKKDAARQGYESFITGCGRCPEVKDIQQALKSL